MKTEDIVAAIQKPAPKATPLMPEPGEYEPYDAYLLRIVSAGSVL